MSVNSMPFDFVHRLSSLHIDESTIVTLQADVAEIERIRRQYRRERERVRRLLSYNPFRSLSREAQVAGANEDLVGNLRAVAERITQDDIHYPDIICVMESNYHSENGETFYMISFKQRRLILQTFLTIHAASRPPYDARFEDSLRRSNQENGFLCGTHPVYRMIPSKYDITCPSAAFENIDYQELSSCISDGALSALQRDVEWIKGIHDEYKAERKRLRRMLTCNPFRSFSLCSEGLDDCFSRCGVLGGFLKLILVIVLSHTSIVLFVVLDCALFFRCIICNIYAF